MGNFLFIAGIVTGVVMAVLCLGIATATVRAGAK